MFRATVRGRKAQIGVEILDEFFRDFVHAVVVVAVPGEVAFGYKAGNNAVFAFDRGYGRVFNCGKRIGYDRKSRDSAREEPLDFAVVKSHLNLLVRVLVVHIMDNVESIDVQPAQPFAVLGKFRHNLVVVEFAGKTLTLGCDLRSAFLVSAAVEREQKKFCKVATRAEKLHLLAHFHGGHAARDRVVVAVDRAHDIVVFVLNRIGVARYARAESFERFG